jgi:ABC-2 type transport system ATP-binding protein
MEKKMIENAVLLVESLKKSFGSVQAVNEISFKVRPGEFFGLLGPNGAGKSTTMKMILGFIDPDAGQISIFGQDPMTAETAIKRHIGYVAEEPLIFKSLTPRELFNFVASIHKLDGAKVSKKLAEYLESLGALEYYDKIIATLSRGNKQKIQIIASLLHEPELLIWDEPLSGLDAKTVKVMKEIMKIHTEKGGSIIFSTHIMQVAEELCDRIAIINKGKIVAIGTMDELRSAAKDHHQDLENIFLDMTNQNEEVAHIIENLRKNKSFLKE